MDFLRLIRSLEELLYEVMSWLLFYPRTLWRVITRPSALAAYADAEMDEEGDEQFIDLMSPPLFLMLSILLAHLIEITLHLNPTAAQSELAREVMESDRNLLMFRSIVFSLFPMLMAGDALRRAGRPMDRNTLKRPFYLQCFFAGPFAVFLSGAATMMRLQNDAVRVAGLVLAVVTMVWYVVTVARWLRSSLAIGFGRSIGIVLSLFVAGCCANFAIALLLFGTP
jgi:hypothetical protein